MRSRKSEAARHRGSLGKEHRVNNASCRWENGSPRRILDPKNGKCFSGSGHPRCKHIVFASEVDGPRRQQSEKCIAVVVLHDISSEKNIIWRFRGRISAA